MKRKMMIKAAIAAIASAAMLFTVSAVASVR